MVRGAETHTLSMLHLNLCVSKSWRCRVTAESTNSLRALVLWEQAVDPSVQGRKLLWPVPTEERCWISAALCPLCLW